MQTAVDSTLCSPADTTPDTRSLEGSQADQALATLAKALGHPVRVQIVRLLARQAHCMYSDLADHLPLARSTVSQHLNILKEAGLIRGTIDGPRVCYCVETREMRRLKLLVTAL